MDMMTEVFNVGDKVECVRDSPDNNDSIAIGVQGVICVIVDSSPIRKWCLPRRGSSVILIVE